MKTYVTFGQIHAHAISGKLFDKDCVAVIEAKDASDGRQIAVDAFGDKFFTSYTEDQFDHNNMKYFPRGFVKVN